MCRVFQPVSYKIMLHDFLSLVTLRGCCFFLHRFKHTYFISTRGVVFDAVKCFVLHFRCI